MPAYVDGHREVELLPDSRREEVQSWRRRCGRGRRRHVLEEKIGSEMEYLSLNLAAAEQVIDEVAQEFDGEDPCRPALRELLDDAKAGLKDELDLARPARGQATLCSS